MEVSAKKHGRTPPCPSEDQSDDEEICSCKIWMMMVGVPPCTSLTANCIFTHFLTFLLFAWCSSTHNFSLLPQPAPIFSLLPQPAGPILVLNYPPCPSMGTGQFPRACQLWYILTIELETSQMLHGWPWNNKCVPFGENLLQKQNFVMHWLENNSPKSKWQSVFSDVDSRGLKAVEGERYLSLRPSGNPRWRF